MKKTFFVFRHGETDWNKLKKLQGQTDIALNQTGVNQARNLRKFFSNHSIDICYSSDLIRALDTAKISLEGQGCKVIKEPALREVNCGVVEGMTRDKVLEKFKERFWDSNSSSEEALQFCYPGGESRRAVRERLVNFIHRLTKESSHQAIGISTHGGALRSLLHNFLPDNAKLLPIPNCVIYKLEFEEDEYKVSGPLDYNLNH